MPRTAPTLVVNVSLTGSDRDYDEHVTFLDQDVPDRPRRHERRRRRRRGAGPEVGRRTPPRSRSPGIREARAAGLYDGELAAIERVMRATTAVPVTDGHALA